MNVRISLFVVLCGLLITPIRTMAQPPEPMPTATAVAANNEMALNLYRLLQADQENVFFSPVSISLALAMALTGAGGDTAAEIAQAMNLAVDMTTDTSALAAAYDSLLTQLNPAAAQCVLRVANRFWVQQDLPLQREYVDLLASAFDSGLAKLDFQDDPEGSRRVINDWVAQQTEDRIQDLIPGGMLNPDTRAVLTNAIYFLGDWASVFEEKATRDRPFHVDKGLDPAVPTMAQTARFPYTGITNGQLLVLPYENNELEMVILLPDAVDGLAELEANLTTDHLNSWLAEAAPVLTDLHLPRFHIAGEFSLNQVLQELGMQKPFTAGADFSGMTTAESLFISNVVHKSFIDVFEQGTEAAAATAIEFERVSEVVASPERVVFHADHPFLFLIRQPATGAILFMGRVTNPATD